MKARSGTPRRAVLPYAGRLDPGGIQMVDCRTRQALIEQQPHRAWVGTGPAKLIRWASVRKLAISPQFISQKPALSVAGSRRRIAKEKQEMTTNQEDPYRRDGFIDKAEAFLRPATHEGYSRSPLFRGPGNGIDQQSDKRRLEVPHGKCCRSVMGSRLVLCYTSSEPHYSEHLRWG